MSAKPWLGGIYLRGGGYKIVLKALQHYKKRVENIGNDPQLVDVPMNLRTLVVEEGKKTSKKIEVVIKILNVGVKDPKIIDQLQFEIPVLEKALTCYHSDIEKIVKNMKEKCYDVFDEPKNLELELPHVQEALVKIKKFA